MRYARLHSICVHEAQSRPNLVTDSKQRQRTLYQLSECNVNTPLQDAIYCIAYATDGSRFASGGADKTVIIWSSAGQGLLKYTHTSTIQALAYNPVTQHLASASETDFGIWSPEAKSVPKKQVTACSRCLAWTHDGQLLALGLEDGKVLLRDKAGEQRAEFAHGNMPVWSLAFAPPASSAQDQHLAVGSWDGTLSFYEV
jgi:intraflagellar transport protein 122